MSFKIRVSVFLLLIFVLFIGCPKKRVTTDVKSESQVFNVSTMIVEKQNISNYIKLGGDVTTETNIDVYPEVQYGKIIRINVNVGQYVRRGDTLVVVDPSLPGASYASNPVTAPISGFVTALYAQVGQVVNSAVPVIRIGVLDNPADIYVKTYVPEKYVSLVKPGMNADIHFSYSKEPFKARVREITPVIDPASRTFEVWLRFVKYESAIKVGSYPDIKLYIESKSDVVVIPIEAVLTRGYNQTVYVYNEDGEKPTASQRVVKTGIRIDGNYEILQGLSAGERLIYKGHSLLVDGSLVTDHQLEQDKLKELDEQAAQEESASDDKSDEKSER